MIVRAVGEQVVAAAHQRFSQCLGIGDDLFGVGFELRLERFAEGDRLGGDNVHQRPALRAGEDRFIDRLGQFLIVGEDQSAARSAQRLMRRRRDDVAVRERIRMRAAHT